jgi:hypothetical protein
MLDAIADAGSYWGCKNSPLRTAAYAPAHASGMSVSES